MFNDKFTDRDIRLGFIRKVYSILAVQLSITAIFVGLASGVPEIGSWMLGRPGLLIAAIVGYFATAFPIICCRGLSRRVPINYILLGTFTVCLTIMCGYIAMNYDYQIVLAAMTCTAAVTIAVTVYAMTTKSDFTIFGPVLFIVGFVFVFICPFFFFWWGRALHLVYCVLGIILFSFYLLFDTQLIMGGKRYECSIDDYILAAMILYLDIINIFLYIL